MTSNDKNYEDAFILKNYLFVLKSYRERGRDRDLPSSGQSQEPM